LALLGWATLFVGKKNGGQVLILISITMLLVGGGIFPPAIGILIGILETRINTPPKGWDAHVPVALRDFLGKAWPWSFAACILAWLCLFPGINILGYCFGVNDPTYTVMLIVLAFGTLGLTVLAGFAQDVKRQSAMQ
jgi:hypothetical protein